MAFFASFLRELPLKYKHVPFKRKKFVVHKPEFLKNNIIENQVITSG